MNEKDAKFEKIIWLMVFVFIVVMVSVFFVKQLSFSDASWRFADKKTGQLHPNEELRQKFFSTRNGLSQVEIIFPGSEKGIEWSISFRLLDGNCQNVIRSVDIELDYIAGSKPIPFRFERLNDSGGETFCVSLKAFPAKGGGALKFHTIRPVESKSISFVEMPYDKETAEKALAMRPAYRNGSFIKNVSELNQRISQYKPWFLKHYFLYAISILFIVLSLSIVALLLLA